MAGAGIPVEISPHIETSLWHKFSLLATSAPRLPAVACGADGRALSPPAPRPVSGLAGVMLRPAGPIIADADGRALIAMWACSALGRLV